MNREPSNQTKPTRHIAIIVLNYNNAPDTIDCVRSLLEFECHDCSIIVVDNCSTDDSVSVIERTLAPESFHFIRSPRNDGYAAGNNIGMEYALESGCTHLCILNNDTVVTDDSISRLADYLDKDSTCIIAGPAILEYRKPTIVQSAGATINLISGSVAPLYCGVPVEELPKDSFPCGYVGGACMMFRASDFDELGPIPENYFLFYEETEWCLRASRSGGLVKCVPYLTILHKGSVSIEKSNINKSDLLLKNKVLFERRNASTFEFVLFAIRYFVVTLGSMVKHGTKSFRRFRLFSQALAKAREEASEG